MRKAVLTTWLVAALAGLGAGCRPPPGTGVEVTNAVPAGSRIAPTPDTGRGATMTSPMPNVAGYSAVAPGPVALPPTTESRNRVDMMEAANPLLPTPTGRTVGSPYDIGAMGELPPQPTEEAPVFRGLRQDF